MKTGLETLEAAPITSLMGPEEPMKDPKCSGKKKTAGTSHLIFPALNFMI